MDHDKRVLADERDAIGRCVTCKRRHIHMDCCETLERRIYANEWRVMPSERDASDMCEVCTEPFVHRATCETLLAREARIGTDPDRPSSPYAGE